LFRTFYAVIFTFAYKACALKFLKTLILEGKARCIHANRTVHEEMAMLHKSFTSKDSC